LQFDKFRGLQFRRDRLARSKVDMNISQRVLHSGHQENAKGRFAGNLTRSPPIQGQRRCASSARSTSRRKSSSRRFGARFGFSLESVKTVDQPVNDGRDAALQSVITDWSLPSSDVITATALSGTR